MIALMSIYSVFLKRKGQEKMITEKFAMQTELVASEDGLHTYEVRRSWSDKGKKGLVLELYPTLSMGRCGELDLSTMHLLNHTKDFGWALVRIVNLYSLVCTGKPKVSELSYDEKNIAYIEEILESKDIADYDIVIATGNTLGTHIKTLEAKIDILSMLREKGLKEQAKYITADSADKEKWIGVHPLFLGLHYGRDIWRLETFPLEDELKALEESIKPKTKETGKKPEKATVPDGKEVVQDVAIIAGEEKAEEKKNAGKKGGVKNVSKDKKQA